MKKLLSQKEKLSEDVVRFYIAELVTAVEIIHSYNFVHRDLRPENIMIQPDGHILLSDYGLKRHADVEEKEAHSFDIDDKKSRMLSDNIDTINELMN